MVLRLLGVHLCQTHISDIHQAFFSSITDMCENGGKKPTPEVSIGFTKEQADTIRRIRNSKDSWDMLGVKPGATRQVSQFKDI